MRRRARRAERQQDVEHRGEVARLVRLALLHPRQGAGEVAGVGEALIGRGRDIVGAAEILGEALRPLELGGGLARSERLEACGGEVVDDIERLLNILLQSHSIENIDEAPMQN